MSGKGKIPDGEVDAVEAVGPFTEDGHPTSKASILPGPAGAEASKANAFFHKTVIDSLFRYQQAILPNERMDVGDPRCRIFLPCSTTRQKHRFVVTRQRLGRDCGHKTKIRKR